MTPADDLELPEEPEHFSEWRKAPLANGLTLTYIDALLSLVGKLKERVRELNEQVDNLNSNVVFLVEDGARDRQHAEQAEARLREDAERAVLMKRLLMTAQAYLSQYVFNVKPRHTDAEYCVRDIRRFLGVPDDRQY